MELYGSAIARLQNWLDFVKAYREANPGRKITLTEISKIYKGQKPPKEERKKERKVRFGPKNATVADIKKMLRDRGYTDKLTGLKKQDLYNLLSVTEERKHAPEEDKKRAVNVWATYQKFLKEENKDIRPKVKLSQLDYQRRYDFEPLIDYEYVKGRKRPKEKKVRKVRFGPKNATVVDIKKMIKDRGYTGKLSGLKKQDLYNILHQLDNQPDVDYGDADEDYEYGYGPLQDEPYPDVYEEKYVDDLPDFAFKNLRSIAYDDKQIDKFYKMTNKDLRNLIAMNQIKPYKGSRNKENLVRRLQYFEDTGKGYY